VALADLILQSTGRWPIWSCSQQEDGRSDPAVNRKMADLILQSTGRWPIWSCSQQEDADMIRSVE